MTDETATALEHEATGCGVALCWWVDSRTRGVGCLREVFEERQAAWSCRSENFCKANAPENVYCMIGISTMATAAFERSCAIGRVGRSTRRYTVSTKGVLD